MSRRSYVRYVVAGVVMLAVGLVLGKDRGNETSFLNTVSAVLLTVGFLVVVVATVLEVIGRARHRARNRV